MVFEVQKHRRKKPRALSFVLRSPQLLQGVKFDVLPAFDALGEHSQSQGVSAFVLCQGFFCSLCMFLSRNLSHFESLIKQGIPSSGEEILASLLGQECLGSHSATAVTLTTNWYNLGAVYFYRTPAKLTSFTLGKVCESSLSKNEAAYIWCKQSMLISSFIQSIRKYHQICLRVGIGRQCAGTLGQEAVHL